MLDTVLGEVSVSPLSFQLNRNTENVSTEHADYQILDTFNVIGQDGPPCLCLCRADETSLNIDWLETTLLLMAMKVMIQFNLYGEREEYYDR